LFWGCFERELIFWGVRGFGVSGFVAKEGEEEVRVCCCVFLEDRTVVTCRSIHRIYNNRHSITPIITGGVLTSNEYLMPFFHAVSNL